MKPNLYSCFYNLIEGWMDEHYDAEEFPAFYVPRNLAEQMAKAAELVFDVAVESQEYKDAVEALDEYECNE